MTNSQAAAEYRVMVGFAVVHSLALLGLGASVPWWLQRLWVGCVTLWFLWVIVLLLHPGRSTRRLAVSLPLLLILMLPSLSLYNFVGPVVFGWPEGLSMNPVEAFKWTQSYLAGRAEAERDIRNDHLVVETYGLGASSGHARELLRDRYAIEVNPTAGCLVNSRILGHAAGYNLISQREIVRRYGQNTFQEVSDEGYRLDAEEAARSKQNAKDRAKTLSTIPSGSNVKLTSVEWWVYDREGHGQPAPPEMAEITEIMHWVENLVVATVPSDAPAFESHISALLRPATPPKLEVSSSNSAARAVHMQIYNQLNTAPDVRPASDTISIAMSFQIGEPRETGSD